MSKQPKLRNKQKRETLTPSIFFIYIILISWAVTTIYPFFWIILNSFRVRGEISVNSFSFPTGDSFTFDNYKTAFSSVDIGTAYRNTFVISISVTVLVMIIAGLAAYGLARFNFTGKAFLQSMIIASMMFPIFATIVPVFRLEVNIGLAGTTTVWKSLLATVLPQVAGNIPFACIVLTTFINSIPIEIEENAYLEGCSIFQIFFRIVLPLARSSFATVAIFAFLWSYNDLFTQTFFLRYPDTKTITLLLNEISSQAGTNYGFMTAAVVLVVIPVIFVYILLQKNIIKGMTAGAIKG